MVVTGSMWLLARSYLLVARPTFAQGKYFTKVLCIAASKNLRQRPKYRFKPKPKPKPIPKPKPKPKSEPYYVWMEGVTARTEPILAKGT